MAAPEDFDMAIEASHRALDEIARGIPAPSSICSASARMPRSRTPSAHQPAVVPRSKRPDGERHRTTATAVRSSFENLAKCVTADLAYLLEVERFETKVGGSNEVTVVALRVTSVFRPEDSRW